MKQLPKISIITPSFNSVNFIEQTIDSVLSQAYPNLEYLIIDGGSSDGTVDLIKKHEKYLDYWVSEPDKGQSQAINKGLIRASGDILNWLNADDFYEKGSLAKVAESFQDPETICFCGKSKIIDEGAKFLKISNGTDVYFENLAKTIGWARIDQPETFYRMTVFEKLRGVNENLHYVMDKEFWMRYLLTFGSQGLYKTDDVLVNFRLHENSKTGSSANKFLEESSEIFCSLAEVGGLPQDAKFIKDLQKIKSQMLPLINWPEVTKEFICKVLQYYYLYLADYYYFRGKRKESTLFLNAIKEEKLEGQDQILYKKLKFRNRFIPTFVQKLKQHWL